MKTPDAGSGKAFELAVDTTPAGGSPLVFGPTVWISASGFLGRLSWLIRPYGIDHDSEVIFVGAGGQGDRGGR